MFETKSYREAFGHMLRNTMDEIDHEVIGTTDEVSHEFPQNEKMRKTLLRFNPIRRYATILNVDGEGTIIATNSKGTAQLVDESQAFVESNDDYSQLRFSSYKIGSLAKLNTAFVSDKHFSVEDYLSTKFARRFAVCEEDLILNGTGVKQPTGILNAGITKTEVSTLTYDAIVSLYFSLKKEYRTDAVWMVSDEMAMKLRSLKDSNGTPLWNINDDTIFSKNVVISSSLDENTILFGDFSYLYLLIRKPISVKVMTERYIASGDYGYAGNERFDSKLTDVNAIKALTITAEE